jgi:hypothetical protein
MADECRGTILHVLKKEDITIKKCPCGKHLIASFFQNDGYLHYDLYDPSGFPNHLADADDLKRFGIDITNGEASVGD